MDHGLFFRLSPNSIPSKGLWMYEYLPIYQENHYPVTVFLESTGLRFFFKDQHTPAQTQLLWLNFANYQNVKGPLSYNISSLLQYPHFRIPASGAQDSPAIHKGGGENEEIEKDYYLKKSSEIPLSFKNTFPPATLNHIYHDPVEPGRDPKLWAIDLPTLLLDLLYDFQYSEVFRFSSRFNSLARVIQSNPVWNCMLLKARYYYAKHKFEHYKAEKAQQEASTTDPDDRYLTELRNEFNAATSIWADTIIQDQSAEVMAFTAWFAKPEMELFRVAGGVCDTRIDEASFKAYYDFEEMEEKGLPKKFYQYARFGNYEGVRRNNPAKTESLPQKDSHISPSNQTDASPPSSKEGRAKKQPPLLPYLLAVVLNFFENMAKKFQVWWWVAQEELSNFWNIFTRRRLILNYEETTDWLLKRFSFFKAWVIAVPAMATLFFLISLVLLILHWQNPGDNGWKWPALSLLTAVLFTSLYGRGFVPFLMFLSPRLIFTLLGAWMFFPFLGETNITSYFVSPIWRILAIGIILLYITIELRTQNFYFGDITLVFRSVLMLFIAVFYITLIGVVTIQETLPSKLQEEKKVLSFLQEKMKKNQLYYEDEVISQRVYLSLSKPDRTQYFQDYISKGEKFQLPEKARLTPILDTLVKSINAAPLLSTYTMSNAEIMRIKWEEFLESEEIEPFPVDLKLGPLEHIKYQKDDRWCIVRIEKGFWFGGKDLYIFPYQLIYYGMVVLFFGLFLGLTLKGRRFTGL